jgi:hypothetical protein
MSTDKISNFVLLPELKLIHFGGDGLILCEKESEEEYCPKCAEKSRQTYDHRWVTIRDEPVRRREITLRILKRRFWCKPCKKPFTEPIPGIIKGRRTTQRFRSAVMEACQKYSDLKSVCIREFVTIQQYRVNLLFFEEFSIKPRQLCTTS